MAELKAGDVVQLKSGGPSMTIADVGDYSMAVGGEGAKCVWFEKTKAFEKVFPLAVLKLDDSDKPLTMRMG